MEERDKSEFNMAISYLGRLNNLFYICDNAAMELDSFTWFHALLAIFRELTTEMKDKEIDEYEKEIPLINNLIQLNLRNSQRTGKREINHELYMKLHSFERKMRMVLRESGLQLKLKESPEFALGKSQ